MRTFVTGGTGLIGRRLVRRLQERGDQPVLLSRRAAVARAIFGPGAEVVEGDPMKRGAWMDAVSSCDGVIHLAGENVFARRWNTAFKQLLVDSRIQSTANVVAAIRRNPRRGDGTPKVLITASAIGWYGPRKDEELTEDSPAASDFMATLCVDWEKTAREAEQEGCRVALVRVGIVLDKDGGALAKLLMPFKLCLGGPIGFGRQYMSWIHHADIVGLFLFALDTREVSGPLNGTAPNPVTNKLFGKALGRALHRPAIFPLPPIILRLALGQVSQIVATGQRVLPKRTLALGYQFRFSGLDEALAEILK